MAAALSSPNSVRRSLPPIARSRPIPPRSWPSGWAKCSARSRWRSQQPVVDRDGLDQAIDLIALAEAELIHGLAGHGGGQDLATRERDLDHDDRAHGFRKSRDLAP